MTKDTTENDPCEGVTCDTSDDDDCVEPISARRIAADVNHTCALLDAGAVRCWGEGKGALGYGNGERIGDDETPASAGDVPFR